MKQKAKVKYSQNKTALFFLWPWILGLIIFTIGPMLISLYYSFTEYNLLSAPRWIGLENYKTMFFGDPLFLTSLTITLKYVVIAVPLKLLAALGGGAFIGERETGSRYISNDLLYSVLIGRKCSCCHALAPNIWY